MKKAVLICLLLCCLLCSCAAAEQAAVSADLTAIRINELMASNGDTLTDRFGESSDWIELYNTSDQPVNLKGLCLSDGKKNLEKFVFPDWILPAHGYLVVFASGVEDVTDDEIHVGFKLSAEGERVVLSFVGEILDIISFDAQEKDVSFARLDDRAWRFTALPTPGAANTFED